MTHEEKIARWIGPGKIGVEIGPGHAPLPGFSPAPVYVDCFKEFGHERCVADYYGHACALPFHDHSLDFVASSHVLEHVANPVAALVEAYRVVRPGGIIYLVVPDRRCSWDHTRPLTRVEHLLDDFHRGTTASDPTHIDDFVYGSDWSRLSPETPPDAIAGQQAALARGMHEAVARGEDINIHFHTFEPSNLLGLIEALRTQGVLLPVAPDDDMAGETVSPVGLPGSENQTSAADQSAARPDGRPVHARSPRRPHRFKWELLDHAESFPASNPNGLLVVLRVHKGWAERAAADWFRIRTAGEPQAALRQDAIPFRDFVRDCSGLGGVR